MYSLDKYWSAKQLWKVLEDFDIIINPQHSVIFDRRADENFRKNLQAAIIASSLGLKGIDRIRREYVEPYYENKNTEKSNDVENLYIQAYQLAKISIKDCFSNLDSNRSESLTLGIFGASAALERLIASFFAMHLMFKLGLLYEGYSVARIILEQIAWAYTAHTYVSIDDIAKIETTKTIGRLKQILPEVEILYGTLSKKTHIDYFSHHQFLKIEDGENYISYTHLEYKEYAHITLKLADLLIIIYEYTQFMYMKKLVSIVLVDNIPQIKSERGFNSVAIALLKKFP
jgi:hypothetical protein